MPVMPSAGGSGWVCRWRAALFLSLIHPLLSASRRARRSVQAPAVARSPRKRQGYPERQGVRHAQRAAADEPDRAGPIPLVNTLRTRLALVQGHSSNTVIEGHDTCAVGLPPGGPVHGSIGQPGEPGASAATHTEGGSMGTVGLSPDSTEHGCTDVPGAGLHADQLSRTVLPPSSSGLDGGTPGPLRSRGRGTPRRGRGTPRRPLGNDCGDDNGKDCQSKHSHCKNG